VPAQGQDLTQKYQRYRDRKAEAVQTVDQGLRAGGGTENWAVVLNRFPDKRADLKICEKRTVDEIFRNIYNTLKILNYA